MDGAVVLSAARSVARAGRRDGTALGLVVPGALLLLALAGWWWSARMAGDMAGGGMAGMSATMSLAAFVVAWAAMMAAMMLPALVPVVKLYARAAERGRVAPLPFFVGGYLALWTATALPGYVAWRALEAPLAAGEAWVGRVAAAALLAAAAWQLSPLKSVCLRHCRSPLGFFLRHGGSAHRRAAALRMGAIHGVFCIACCWALFAVLVTLGTMNLLWMAVLTAVVVLEKTATAGERVALAAAVVLGVLGALLVADPSLLVHLT
jgi:predicted metal-binding membrane protein